MLPERRFFTNEELERLYVGRFVFDVESYKNYFLVAFKCLETGKYAYFESIEDEPIAVNWLYWFMTTFCIVGFNCKNYDLPMIGFAMTGTNRASHLKAASNRIIVDGIDTRTLNKEFGSNLPENVNFVDLIEVAPLKGSLKVYASRLHARHMQDLPYDPDTVLTREEIAEVRTYCFNDLDNTELLVKELNEHLELRAALSAEYGRDMRSLSDSQMAEEIIATELTKLTGKRPKRPGFEKLVGTFFRYEAPGYVKFISPELNAVLAEIQAADIEIDGGGHVICPKTIDGRAIFIGGKKYTIGVGGLHSTEKRQAIKRSNSIRILDRDVTGYYPNLILKNKFAPRHLGEVFLIALQGIVDKRYSAKKAGRKTEADGLKIASNGTFGKTSDPWSIVYDPWVMVHTTLTGQLSLLMAIERLVYAGFEVISANTDGIVTLCPQYEYDAFCAIFKQWEIDTQLETEETEYDGLYSKDVNNYVAIKLDGKHKAKGIYSEFGSAHNGPLSKNPTHFVTIDAVVAKLTKGTPIEETIHACDDFRRFVTVVKATDGAQKDGRYLGKVIRWYYARGTLGTINGCKRGNKISLSDGGKPVMLMPSIFPDDVDYARYVEIATCVLEDIGFQYRRNEQFTMLT